MVGLLLGSGPLAFESVLPCTFRHFRYFESDRGVPDEFEGTC